MGWCRRRRGVYEAKWMLKWPRRSLALTPEATTRKNGSEERFIFHISSRNFIEIRLSTVK